MEDDSREMELWYDKRIRELEIELDRVTNQLIDLQFESNYNKQDELLEFVRDLFISLQNVDEKLSKEEIVENLKKYIQNFAKDNHLQL